jgi:hypothetical protein
VQAVPGASQVAVPSQSMQQIWPGSHVAAPQATPGPASDAPASVLPASGPGHAGPGQTEPGGPQVPVPSQSMQQTCAGVQVSAPQETPAPESVAVGVCPQAQPAAASCTPRATTPSADAREGNGARTIGPPCAG